jgi:hypothetical protein
MAYGLDFPTYPLAPEKMPIVPCQYPAESATHHDVKHAK